MRQPASIITTAASVAALLGSLALAPVGTASAGEASASVIEQGKEIAFNRKLGNCLACHQMDDGKLAGNIGPPLVAMKQRFPDKEKLRAQIYDATKNNPNTIMPPFGRNHILTREQIDKVVDYVYTL